MRAFTTTEQVAIDRLKRREALDSSIHEVTLFGDLRVVPALFALVREAD